jgi:putative transposase
MDANLKRKVDQLVSDLTAQTQTLDDLNGLFRSWMTSDLERLLNTEMDLPLGRRTLSSLPPDPTPHPDPETPKNRRNGHSQKTVRGELGELTLDTPRDRLGTFDPQLIPQPQRRLTGFDEKILALYAKGLTTRAIPDIVQERYDVDVSATLISEITADLDAAVTQGRQRRLDSF